MGKSHGRAVATARCRPGQASISSRIGREKVCVEAARASGSDYGPTVSDALWIVMYGLGRSNSAPENRNGSRASREWDSYRLHRGQLPFERLVVLLPRVIEAGRHRIGEGVLLVRDNSHRDGGGDILWLHHFDTCEHVHVPRDLLAPKLGRSDWVMEHAVALQPLQTANQPTRLGAASVYSTHTVSDLNMNT